MVFVKRSCCFKVLYVSEINFRRNLYWSFISTLLISCVLSKIPSKLKRKVQKWMNKNQIRTPTTWFKVTFLSPIWRSPFQPLKGSCFNHPKKGTIAELPGRLWFFGIWCGWGPFPSWAISFWRPFWRISSRIQSWPTCQKWLLAGHLSKSWYPKILPPTEPWNHLLGFFPNRTFPPEPPNQLAKIMKGTYCPGTIPQYQKPPELRAPFLTFRKSFFCICTSLLGSPEPSRSFEKMARYTVLVSMNDLKINGWLRLFHPERRGATTRPNFWDTHASNHPIFWGDVQSEMMNHNTHPKEMPDFTWYSHAFGWLDTQLTPKGYPLPVFQLKAWKCWEE